MPANNRNLTRAIRARMEITGEKYTEARRRYLAGEPMPSPKKPAALEPEPEDVPPPRPIVVMPPPTVPQAGIAYVFRSPGPDPHGPDVPPDFVGGSARRSWQTPAAAAQHVRRRSRSTGLVPPAVFTEPGAQPEEGA